MDDKVPEDGVIGNGEYAIRKFLDAAGLGKWDKYEETARAVADFWTDFLYTPDDVPVNLLLGRDQLIVVKDSFYSICAFNLFPFWGTVFVGYLGAKGVLELTYIQDNIKGMSHEIMTQEVLAEDVAYWLAGALGHADVGVIVIGNHFNIKDGLRIQESVSSMMLGAFREEPSVRQEFLDLCALCEE